MFKKKTGLNRAGFFIYNNHNFTFQKGKGLTNSKDLEKAGA